MKSSETTIVTKFLCKIGLFSERDVQQDLAKLKEHRDPLFLLIVITLIMLLLEYFGWQRPFLRLIAPKFNLTQNIHMRLLYAQAYTTFSFFILFIILPSLALKLIAPKEKLEGLRAIEISYIRPYVIFAAVMFTSLLFVCSSPSFYRFYPLFRPLSYMEWVSFESIYLAQFIAVEYFFRGPLLHRLNRTFGISSLAIMTLPYALIHIHKPFPEALGSIVAGLILGHLSLKSKSIWLGVLLHIFVAFCADSLGLFYGGDFTRW